MATTTCIKCAGTQFELKALNNTGSQFKYSAVQCAQCGTAIGVLDFMNTGAQLQDVQKALRNMTDNIDMALHAINDKLQRIKV